MNRYITKFKAINHVTGELTTYCGKHILGISMKDAQEHCNKYHPYLEVIGQLRQETALHTTKKIDYDIITNN